MSTKQQEEELLVDYDEEATTLEPTETKPSTGSADVKKGSYAGIHSSGFRDFLLKSELLLAVTDCGFEHPSEGSILYSKHNINHLFSHFLSFSFIHSIR